MSMLGDLSYWDSRSKSPTVLETSIFLQGTLQPLPQRDTELRHAAGNLIVKESVQSKMGGS
jgi:hypothetical protein